MQQLSPTQPSSAASSFAGLLATLTSPKPVAAEDEALWSSSDLGEDVASLSYERALRAHARYRPASRGDEAPMPSFESGPAAVETTTGPGIANAAEATATVLSRLSGSVQDRDLRSASVTIRLSRAECERLRNRAAEADLTVSAYLRSCALEVEALRAEVKKTLAELKAGTEATVKTEAAAAKKQEAKQSGRRGKDGVRLTRILGHLGRFWMGFAADQPAHAPVQAAVQPRT